MPKTPTRVSGQTIACAWCSREFTLSARGRLPKWCSQSCRQRAWEQRRAARSGVAAVEVVRQTVQVEKVVKVTVVQPVPVPALPFGRAWPGVLAELADQLDRGRVYDRDLIDLEAALRDVLLSLERRPAFQRRLRRTASAPGGYGVRKPC